MNSFSFENKLQTENMAAYNVHETSGYARKLHHVVSIAYHGYAMDIRAKTIHVDTCSILHYRVMK